MSNVIELTSYQSVGVAALVLLLGRLFTRRFPILHKYCIPAPVVGGFIFAVLNLIAHVSGIGSITFDTTFQTFFMTVFYCTVGTTASFRQLKKGGRQVATFLILVIILCTMQNVVGISLAGVFGMDPRLGLAMGSIPLVGGHGTSGSFGPLLENMGINGATTVAIASATFGLVAGSVMGGPLAGARIRRLGSKTSIFTEVAYAEDIESVAEEEDNDEISVLSYAAAVEALEEARRKSINQERFLNAAMFLAVAIGAGTLVYNFFIDHGITFPTYIGAMLLACLMRNISDMKKLEAPLEEIDAIGHLSLNLYLALALMGLRLWELADLAVPMIVILLAECAALAIFAYFIVFNFMGRDYEASCFVTATCGFGMGATANAMANISAVNKKHGPSPKALFIVPLVGALFIDFCNSLIITGFLNGMM